MIKKETQNTTKQDITMQNIAPQNIKTQDETKQKSTTQNTSIKKRKKEYMFLKIFIIFLIIVILFIFEILRSNSFIGLKKYNFKSDKINQKFSFVLISDLHDKEFDEANIKLITKISEQNPDFIAVDGDMVLNTKTDISVFKNLLIELVKIAPVYCVYGNHERDLLNKIDFNSEVENLGALFLDNEDVVFTTSSGEKILIGGLSDYPFYEFDEPDYNTPQKHFWDSFNEKTLNYDYSILLHHQPEFISTNLADSNIDLVLCGHTHGGMIRLPFLGGLFAPNQGIFAGKILPQYTKGLYEFNNTKMVITAGLSKSGKIPRFGNPPEVCVITISNN